jgi:hypothetical protein
MGLQAKSARTHEICRTSATSLHCIKRCVACRQSLSSENFREFVCSASTLAEIAKTPIRKSY